MNRETSKLAYNELKYTGQHKNQKDTIADILIYYPNGLSLREICEKTGFDINAVSGRVNDLKKDGMLKTTQKRRCSITNRLINPVWISSKGENNNGTT